MIEYLLYLCGALLEFTWMLGSRVFIIIRAYMVGLFGFVGCISAPMICGGEEGVAVVILFILGFVY